MDDLSTKCHVPLEKERTNALMFVEPQCPRKIVVSINERISFKYPESSSQWFTWAMFYKKHHEN
jgi:hypothetical protein